VLKVSIDKRRIPTRKVATPRNHSYGNQV